MSDYIKQAKKGTHSLISKLIDEWNKLSDEVKSENPLLWWLLGKSTAYFKMPKEEALYTDKSTVKGQMCSNCMFSYQHIESGNYICDQIGMDKKKNDLIKPAGWCRLWKGNSIKKSEINQAYKELGLK